MIIESVEKFLLALESGLTLCGQTEHKEPEFIGTDEQWSLYQKELSKRGL